jgi:hypothetical protein
MVSKDKPDLNEVLTVVTRLAQCDSPVSVARSFEGLFIHQKVRILSVAERILVCQANDFRLLAGMEGRCVYLLHAALPRPVKARLNSFATDSCKFVLSDLVFIDKEWNERSGERVHPRETTTISIKFYYKKLSATLEDINPQGLGVRVNKRHQEVRTLLPSTPVHLDFKLPPSFGWHELKGTVVTLKPMTAPFSRIGIRLNPHPGQNRMLEEYMAYRKTEIIEEMDQASLMAKRAPEGASLYF